MNLSLIGFNNFPDKESDSVLQYDSIKRILVLVKNKYLNNLEIKQIGKDTPGPLVTIF